MTLALIANPRAGGRKGARVIPQVEALLRHHRIDYRLFVTDVARTAHRWKRLGGLSYVLGVVCCTLRLRCHRMQLEIDGVRIDGDNCFVAFCNSRYTGGRMLMAPEARIDDGRFDVVVAAPLGRRSLLAAFPRIFRGAHGTHPAVRVFRARQATVVTDPPKPLLPDGELFGSTPTTIAIQPRRVRYFA